MSAVDLAAVIVAIASVAAVVLLGFTLAAALRTLRAVHDAVEAFHDEALPVMAELAEAVRVANGELDRVDGIIDRAESISGTVDASSKLAYRAISAPVIKAMAVASGTSEAARGFRRRRARSR
ncbi:MAG: hypothetical protein AB7L84_15940 [Acidimicrobiia bacterium]